jgi:hypothetical protein
VKIPWKKIAAIMPYILELLQAIHELLDPPDPPRKNKKAPPPQEDPEPG